MPDARPQVLTLTAGAQSVTLDTATVARAVTTMRGLGMNWYVDGLHADAVRTLADALRDVCGPDHLDAVRHVRVGATTPTE